MTCLGHQRASWGWSPSPWVWKMQIVARWTGRGEGHPGVESGPGRARGAEAGRQEGSAAGLALLLLPVLTVCLRLPQGEPDPAEPIRVGDLGECFFPLSNTAVSAGPENLLCEMEAVPFSPVRSWLKHEGSQGEGSAPHQLPAALLSVAASEAAG